jgi:hypothetical protein
MQTHTLTEKVKLEKDVMREVCERLTEMGLFFWRSNNVPVFSRNNGGKMAFRSLPKYTPRGLPDIMLIINGHFIALEIKRPGINFLRPEQETYRDQLMQHGGDYYVITSVDELMAVAFQTL